MPHTIFLISAAHREIHIYRRLLDKPTCCMVPTCLELFVSNHVTMCPLQKKCGIIPGLQRLMYAGKMLLDDQRTLEQYGLSLCLNTKADASYIITIIINHHRHRCGHHHHHHHHHHSGEVVDFSKSQSMCTAKFCANPTTQQKLTVVLHAACCNRSDCVNPSATEWLIGTRCSRCGR